MELKTARFTLLIDPNKKAAFERLCAQLDRTPSQVVRQLIRDYLALHGVQYVGSGGPKQVAEVAAGEPGTGAPTASRRTPATSLKKRKRA